MSDATGIWNIMIDTPFGAQEATLDLVVEGDSVSGTAHSSAGEITLREGTAQGDALTIPIEMSDPFAFTATIELTVSGDSLEGEIMGGPVPGIRVSGTRA